MGEEEGSGKTNAGTLALIEAFGAEVAEVPKDAIGRALAARRARLPAEQRERVPGAARGARRGHLEDRRP